MLNACMVHPHQQHFQIASPHLLPSHCLPPAVQPLSFQSVAEDTKVFLTTTNPGKVTMVAAGAVLAGSFVLACWRYWQKFQSAQSKRQRQVRRMSSVLHLGQHQWLVTYVDLFTSSTSHTCTALRMLMHHSC